MAKIQGICPGQRIIRDSELGFGVKKFRIQGISSGTAGDPGKRDPGQRGATVLEYSYSRFLTASHPSAALPRAFKLRARSQGLVRSVFVLFHLVLPVFHPKVIRSCCSAGNTVNQDI